MKILLTDRATLVSDNDLDLGIFEQLGEVKEFENIPRADLLEEVKDTNIILCNKTIIDDEVFSNAPNLKYVGLFATGYNNIDLVSAKKYGVTVCNVAGYSTNAVAQQVIAYILMHYTKINEYNSFVKQGGWKKAPTFCPLVFSTDEVFGKTLGIVGYGAIGKAVEKAALGLGMNVLVYTRSKHNEEKFVSFHELLEKSDVLTLHCPLNEQSKDLMNDETFAKMKKGAYFINTSRGGTVDENALEKALLSGHLSGAAVDVLKQEPMNSESRLDKIDNLIITPHTAWAPLETRKRLIKLVYKSLSDFLNGKEVNNLAK